MRSMSCIALLVLLAQSATAHAQAAKEHERQELLKACNRLPGRYLAKCERVVNDGLVPLNTLRICAYVIDAKAALYHYRLPTREQLRALPHAAQCEQGLRSAGVAVNVSR